MTRTIYPDLHGHALPELIETMSPTVAAESFENWDDTRLFIGRAINDLILAGKDHIQIQRALTDGSAWGPVGKLFFKIFGQPDLNEIFEKLDRPLIDREWPLGELRPGRLAQ